MPSWCVMPPALRLALLVALVGVAPAVAGDPVFEFRPPSDAARTNGPVTDIPGPDPEIYPAFPPGSRAAEFDGKGSYLRLPDQGTALQFSNGDGITIETWIRLDRISNGQNQYLIGKGRTHRPGYHRDNQNWALRLRGLGGAAQVSFLFRSRDEDGQPGAFHRWNSDLAISPGKRWHHLAIRYEFGKPKSARAVVDGKVCTGSWDMAGATTREPVTDDDETWLGSALGGAEGNSFRGAMASVSVHRSALPPELLASRYDVRRIMPAPDLAGLAPSHVRVAMFRSDDGHTEWPLFVESPVRTVDTEAFALFRLPPTYGAGGRRLGQDGTHLVRLAARVALPAGEHEILLRAPGMTRLRINGDELLALGPSEKKRDAHGALRPAADPPYPRARLGTKEVTGAFQSDGTPALVVVDAIVGDAFSKTQVGELLVAIRPPQSSWTLLSPGETVPFDQESTQRYKIRERERFDAADTALRRELSASTTAAWARRHETARRYVETLPALPIPELPGGFEARNPIDHFLARKIAAAQALAESADEEFPMVHALLEENCFRCHGKKSKGGLRLNSRKAALEGGETGPAIVPGDAAAGELLARVLSNDADERMPPKGDGLSDDEVAQLRTWINDGARWGQPTANVIIPGNLEDLPFLRRLFLDTVGVFPSPAEVDAYLRDSAPDRTARLIDRLLADPRHAGHWVGYWQDVLAENPLLVKPTRNNTGPFRWWLHEALLDNMPFDRFVTELVTFSGGTYSGAAAGFKVASDNDAPMAAKAHILGAAVLGTDMKCARCHDAPFHSHTQEDLFSVAAMLQKKPARVPPTSTVPASFFAKAGERKALIKVTLDPETPVEPKWPFADLAPPPAADPDANPAEILAAQITRPENRRFARVIVNRLWKRYFGEGLVEPAHDWEGQDPSHPALLEFLAREFTANGCDLRHVSRLILDSAAYRRAPRCALAGPAAARFFEAPIRRRLTAEQLVDSLFAATGTPVYSEELTLDVEGAQPHKNFLNLGHPRRAWEFVSLSTERDRPSLTLPYAAAIVSFMEAHAWRPDRSDPRTDRRGEPNLRQAGIMANGLTTTWWSRLSDFSDLTRLALDTPSADAFIDGLYLRLLTRRPTPAERESARALLAPDFASRLTRPRAEFSKDLFIPKVREISWSNHLHPEATRLAKELEDEAHLGPPPTDFLSPGWREAAEDVIWSLINSPEMPFVP